MDFSHVCEVCGADVDELHQMYPYDPKIASDWMCDTCLKAWEAENEEK